MYLEIPLDQIAPNPDQPRRYFDPVALDELAGSIVALGVLEALLVRPVDDGYVLIAGERRWRASRLAGLHAVDCRVLELDEVDAFVASVAENVNRADMRPLEESDAYSRLVRYGQTPDQVAATFGKTLTYVEIRLGFERLIPEARTLLDRGDLSLTLARHLSPLRDGDQLAVLNRRARGELATDSEAVALAIGLRDAAEQVGFFDLEEPTATDRRDHRVRSRATRAAMDSTEQTIATLRALAAPDPAELATTLGDEVTYRLDQVERLVAAARSARVAVRRAKAHADAAQLTVRADVL